MTELAELDPSVFAPIRALVLDVDGVLTDGGIVYTSGGEEIKTFHVRDGSGIKYWCRAGYRCAFLTGRSSPVVERRAEELGVAPVIQGAREKGAAFDRIVETLGVPAEAVAYVGDDLPDLPALRAAGLPLAVADAVPEVKDAARAVTASCGGRGAVREVVETILRAQGRWDALLERYR